MNLKYFFSITLFLPIFLTNGMELTHCLNKIFNLVQQEAINCKLISKDPITRLFSDTINVEIKEELGDRWRCESTEEFIFPDNRLARLLHSNNFNSFLRFFSKHGRFIHSVQLNPKHAQKLNKVLCKKEIGYLNEKDKEYLQKEIMAIRHELGHAYDAQNRGYIESIRKWSFAIASTCTFIAFCKSYESDINLNMKFVDLPCCLGLCLGYLFNGLAASLYSRTWEQRADDFGIRHTIEPKYLTSMANWFKKRHDQKNKSSHSIITTLSNPFLHYLNLVTGSSTHPSEYSRYKKFQQAYENRIAKSAQNT